MHSYVPSWYSDSMGNRLSDSNPYMRDPAERKRSVLKSVATSSAIEGIHAPFRGTSGTAAKSIGPARRTSKFKR